MQTRLHDGSNHASLQSYYSNQMFGMNLSWCYKCLNAQKHLQKSLYKITQCGLSDTVNFCHRTRESTEYTVLHTSVYMGKNQKLIFFIPDANLTSIK